MNILSDNQIEDDLNEESEETMSASEENVKKAQINVQENLELKLATQATVQVNEIISQLLGDIFYALHLCRECIHQRGVVDH